MLYDIHAVSEVVGLSPVTLQSYTSRGKSDLARGIDFIVRRTSPYRHKLMITDRGLFRLQARQYHVFRESAHTATVMPAEKIPSALRVDLCRSERIQRLRAVVR